LVCGRPDHQFLILVLLLKRFLYGPIVQAMDARGKNRLSIGGSPAKRQEAEQEERFLSQKIRNIEDQAQEMLASREEAQAHKKLRPGRENVEQVRQMGGVR
jgi:F-type H+-transporting ATPase subunit b